MKHITLLFSLFLCYTLSAQNTAYEQAWEALNHNQRDKAEELFKKALTSETTAEDAYISNLYLAAFNGRSERITDFESSFFNKTKNPYPYTYSLWHSAAVAGTTGKKTIAHQLRLIDRLIADKNTPRSLTASAHYQRLMHHIFANEPDKKKRFADAMGVIQNWQFTGPFENLAESGFYKDYGPLGNPKPEAVFRSSTNAEVKWFTPSAEVTEGWILLINHFEKPEAVIYAQTFINSPSDMEAICNVGFGGALKLWINDELILTHSKELATEYDFLAAKVKLQEGTNRVLVQLSYTATSSLPNFAVRFTDDTYKPIQGLQGSTVYSDYKKQNLNSDAELIAHFAEEFFKNKIKSQPTNPVNFLLLTDFYLRNNQLIEARNTISEALAQAPDNGLLRFKLLDILNREGNKTMYSEELEKLKHDDPSCLQVMHAKLDELYSNRKYQECEDLLAERIRLYGEDQSTAGLQVLLLIADEKYDELVKLAEKLYVKNPNDAELTEWMFTNRKDVYQNKKAAFKVFERFASNSYHYGTYKAYADALIEAGDQKKGLAIKDKIVKQFPYSPKMSFELARYYFGIKQYDKADEYLSKSLSVSPYSESYWELKGDIYREKKNSKNALQAYQRSLELNPNQYSLIGKIRKLKNQPEIYTLFDEVDVLKVIEQDKISEAKNADYGFYYILDKVDAIVYPEGANEQFVTVLIRITNDKGIENYKETAIGYGYGQSLLIENSQVIKPNKSRINGERNGNEIVFPNLEVGDVVYLRYRLQSFSTGRLGREFWTKHHFTGHIYSSIVSYNLLVPANKKLQYVLTKSNLKPVISEVEDFKKYSWNMQNGDALKNEPLMPLMVDAASVLHLSTITDWGEITGWYSDGLSNKSEENIEIMSLYQTLFPDEKSSKTEYEKARSIYDYIAANIKYSSVPFRQGPLIPQRASTTVTSKLGDCKDLSNLFVTLAHMAGINAQLVLIDTRDNGMNDIMLPSMDFNHCIAKAELDGKPYYIELTDNHLPFASLPNTLNGALALEIPSKSLMKQSNLVHLEANNRTKDVIKRHLVITPQDADIKVHAKTTMSGAVSSYIRGQFRNLDEEKQRQDMEQNIGRSYKNTLRMENLRFENLDQLEDSLSYSMNFSVKNEIHEIGNMKALKLTYPDVIATLDNFAADERDYPIEYWNYETIDEYETTVVIKAPDGATFVDIPTNEALSFRQLSYEIRYVKKSDRELEITRKFVNDRPQQIMPEDYAAFKSFFEKILKAEQRFIAFK